MAAEEKRQITLRKLRVGDIDERPRRFAKPAVLRITGDADDRQPPHRLGRAGPEVAVFENLADRIFVWPDVARHVLVDDGDVRSAGPIRVGELTAARQRDLERRQESGCHRVPVGVDVALRGRVSGAAQCAESETAALERHHARRADRRDAGHRREPGRDVSGGAGHAIVGIVAESKIDVGDLDVVDAHARIDPRRRAERAQEQAAHHQKNQAERQLRADDEVTQTLPARRVGVGLEIGNQSGADALQRRHQSGQQAGGKRKRGGERQHAPIDREGNADGDRQRADDCGEHTRHQRRDQ